MHPLYDQLQKERRDNYNNGLYYVYKHNIISTISNLCHLHLTPFHVSIFIEDDMIPADTKNLPSKIPRKLILGSNRYTPDWMLDHFHDNLGSQYLCELHRQLTFLPLRDIFRIDSWSGKILSPQKEETLAGILFQEHESLGDWYRHVVPEIRKLMPFKHGNVLFLYMLFVRECLKWDAFPPVLQGDYLSMEAHPDIDMLLAEANAQVSDLRY